MPESTGLIIRPMSGLAQMMSRLYDAPPDSIRGLDPTSWGSPLQPIKPIAPEGTEPRGFQWWWGQNLVFTPRPDAEYSAADLKELARYPLARICIENVKDQVCRSKRQVMLKSKPGESKRDSAKRAQGDANLRKLNAFFDYPDSEHGWSEWLRPLLDDMLVTDAPATLVRKTMKGEVAELRVIRGESIVRLIDDNGFTPLPPSPAYQQNWWGLPLVDLTTEQLVYKPRNIVPRNTVSSQLYGMSPTEQLADEIKVGIKRLEFVLAYYTEGSTPGVVHVVPRGTAPDKISEAMLWMNSELSGNLAARRQWRMIPGFNEPGKDDQIIQMKEALLADTFDEMHIRKICFGYGTSPQRLMRMMGTRNADAQQEASMEEGLLPWLDWLKGYIDWIIQKLMGLTDYEMVFDPFRETDPVKEAEAAKIYVSSCIRSPNEVREQLGDDPRSEAEANMIGTITGSGFVPITGSGALTTPAPQPEPLGGGGFGDRTDGGGDGEEKPKPGEEKPKPNGNGKGTEKSHCQRHARYDEGCITCARAEVRRLEKLAPPLATNAIAQRRVKPTHKNGPVGFAPQLAVESVEVTAPSRRCGVRVDKRRNAGRFVISGFHMLPTSQDANIRFARIVAASFEDMKRSIRHELLVRPLQKIVKVDKETPEQLADRLFAAIKKDFEKLPTDLRPLLEQAAKAGINEGMAQIQIIDSDIIGGASTVARDWAVNRAAELVGMRYDDEGQLVENPNAKWAITDKTREDIRRIVVQAFEEEETERALLEAIADSGTFSESRAAMISRTEVGRAQGLGNLEVWRESGLVTGIDWVLGGAHDVDDECDDLADGGPYAIDDVPDFPAHPNCECLLVASTIEED